VAGRKGYFWGVTVLVKLRVFDEFRRMKREPLDQPARPVLTDLIAAAEVPR
jgi:hypothetical protein